MPDSPLLAQVIVGVVTAVLVFLGSWLAFRGTKGKTQADYRTAMERRVDEKMEKYTQTVEARAERYEKKNAELEAKYEELDARYEDMERQYKTLETDQKESVFRETLLYQYISSLRQHVVLQKPPPPPPIPPELESWFEDIEDTFPTGLS